MPSLIVLPAPALRRHCARKCRGLICEQLRRCQNRSALTSPTNLRFSAGRAVSQARAATSAFWGAMRESGTTELLSCPERQLPLQNYGKPPFVQPTAHGQLLGSIGKGRYGGKGVETGHQRANAPGTSPLPGTSGPLLTCELEASLPPPKADYLTRPPTRHPSRGNAAHPHPHNLLTSERACVRAGKDP